MLDFEGSMVEKKDRSIIIMSDIRYSERMERETLENELDMSLTDKLHYKEQSGCDSVDESFADLLAKDDTMTHYKTHE